MRNSIRALFIVFAFLLLPFPSATASASVRAGRESNPPISILLVGRDGFQDQAARSDCMILCSFSPDTGRILLTSFLRDLYVPIPGHSDNRLNAAYAFGGMALLQETLEKNFDISVDGCIEVDFSSFPVIIDALGGVSLDLRQDEADAVNREIPGSLHEGVCLLTGEQALAYSRIRKLDQDGDFSRSLRQRKLLTSLAESYRKADLLTVLSAVADTLPMITTTFSNRDILCLCIKLFPILENPSITSQRFPSEGNCSYDTVRGMNVLRADLNILRRDLQQSLIAINQPAA